MDEKVVRFVLKDGKIIAIEGICCDNFRYMYERGFFFFTRYDQLFPFPRKPETVSSLQMGMFEDGRWGKGYNSNAERLILKFCPCCGAKIEFSEVKNDRKTRREGARQEGKGQ